VTQLRLLDSVIAVEAPPEMVRHLDGLFALDSGGETATGWLCAAPVEDEWRLSSSTGEVMTARSWSEAVEVVAAMLNALALDQCKAFAVHAGVVARAGRVVAYPATSGTGKSTLTAALLMQGWDYVSDEALVVDERTRLVRPYARPLALHAWTLARLGLPAASPDLIERLVLPDELGARAVTASLPLTDVVLLQRGPALSLLPARRGTVAAALLAQSFNHYRDPIASFRLVTELTPRLHVWDLTVGDPVEAATLLGRTLV